MTKYTSYTEAFVSGLLWKHQHEEYTAYELIKTLSDIKEEETIAREHGLVPQTTAISRTPQGYPSTTLLHDLYLAAEHRIFDLEEELRQERKQCARWEAASLKCEEDLQGVVSKQADEIQAATAADKFLRQCGWTWNGEKWIHPGLDI